GQGPPAGAHLTGLPERDGGRRLRAGDAVGRAEVPDRKRTLSGRRRRSGDAPGAAEGVRRVRLEPLLGQSVPLLRNQQLEARPPRARVVDKVSSVSLRVRAGDREAEAVARLAAATGEALEHATLELFRDAGAFVLDGNAEMPVALVRDDPDRRRPLADRLPTQ